MDMYETPGNHSSTDDINRRQMTVMAQLFRAVTTMNHIDELFRWLAYMMVQRFDVQLTQLWANQNDYADLNVVRLRSMVRQDSSLPEQISVNDQVASIAQRMARERPTYYPPQSVEGVFSHYQAILLKRHGLNYFAGCFTSSNAAPLPRNNPLYEQPFGERSAGPFTVIMLLFFRRTPHVDLIPAVGSVLEQALAAAEKRGLLLPAGAANPPGVNNYGANSYIAPGNYYQPPQPTPRPQAPPPPRDPLASLQELIPQRKQDSSLMLSSNPFSNSTVIKDKQARRLYAAIDGRTNVAGLCEATGMDIKDVYMALRTLLILHRIELLGPQGQPVDASILDNR